VKRWYEKRSKSNSEGRSLSTKEYIELIEQLSLHWKHVYLIVDALDECSDRKAFIDVLTQIAANSKMKMIVTSRHEVDLERLIRPIAGFPVDLKHHMSDDIKSFVYDEVRRRRLSGTLKCKNERLEIAISSAISQNSSEM